MAEFDTGRDILRNVVRRSGEILPTETLETNADHLIDIKLYINESYWELCALKPWLWDRKRLQFSSVGSRTGSVNSISGTAVTLGAALSTSVAGYKFLLESDGIPHRILSHTAGTTAVVLASSYTGVGTNGNYTIYNDEVTVASDILAFPVISELHWGDDITIVPESELIKEFPRNVYGTTRAQYAAFITNSTIRIAPWTTSARLFEISYNYRPDPLDFSGNASTDTPIVPRDSRHIIAKRALMKLYSDKRDERLPNVAREFDEALSKLSTIESTFAKPRLRIPRNFRVRP